MYDKIVKLIKERLLNSYTLFGLSLLLVYFMGYIVSQATYASASTIVVGAAAYFIIKKK